MFAQVTNPPLDAIREELVTSMGSTIGPEGNLLDPQPESCHQITIKYPVIDNDQLAKLRHLYYPGFRSITLSMVFDPRQDGPGLEWAMADLKRRASDALAAGYNILILSDRGVDRDHAPIPSLLATAGVHHHLVLEGTRTRCALVVESGDAREVHHCALLLGYGAGVVNPYLAFETLDDMIRQGLLLGITHEKAVTNYIKALNKGILKVMSKMGISTLQSYCGAQIFEAVGLEKAFVDKYFTWTASRIGGVGIGVVAEEVIVRHRRAFDDRTGGRARARFGRRVPVAARRRVPPLQPRDRLQAAARDAKRPVRDLQGIHQAGRRPEPQPRDAARAADARSRRPRRFRSTRSSRSSRSSSASRPARCPTGRSARKRTRRSRSP